MRQTPADRRRSSTKSLPYDNLGYLTAALQCQRAFMVIAGIFAVCGLVAGTVGQNCVHALEGKPKLYSARSGGALMMIAGNFSDIVIFDVTYQKVCKDAINHAFEIRLKNILSS